MINGLRFITGSSGAGKTTLCLDLVTRMQEAGVVVGGFLSPPIFKRDQKIGFDLLNLWTGERRQLGILNLGEPLRVFTQKWQFDEDVIQWGNDVLAERTACEVFFFDEIGPVEFEQRKGMLEALCILDEQVYPDALIVIRPSLLAIAQKRWPWGRLYTGLDQTVS